MFMSLLVLLGIMPVLTMAEPYGHKGGECGHENYSDNYYVLSWDQGSSSFDGEGSENLFDSKSGTKWCSEFSEDNKPYVIFHFGGDVATVNYRSVEPQTIVASKDGVAYKEIALNVYAIDEDDLLLTSDVDNNAVCVGYSTQVTLSVILPDYLPEDVNCEYSWITGETTQSIVVTPTEATEYNVTFRSGNCEIVKSITITVNSLPTVAISGIETICSGTEFTLTAEAQGGSGQYTTYQWYNSRNN